ncbi:GntR family transcriptional regulator [Humidisolicoccus flavus]|uniref:GntR family transcriptional regulator n=1 Tax=Humidisolicoccus flavus TaxID=3111414 RepID=UPI00324C9D31
MVADGREASLYEELRGRILSLEYVPGERVTERSLETDLGASRTPIRAALLRLEVDGLIRRESRAWRVTPIDLSEIRALTEFREGLETAIVALVVERAREEDFADLLAVLDGADEAGPAEAIRAGGDFHALLAEIAENPFYSEAMRGVMVRLQRARWLVVRTAEERADVKAQHRAIVGALQARDLQRAQELAIAHLRASAEQTLRVLRADRQRFRGHGLEVVES